jgi:cytochrome P450
LSPAWQWAYYLPIPHVRHTLDSFDELELYLQQMVADRRSSGADPREGDEGRPDILGSLVFANSRDVQEDEEGGRGGSSKAAATLTDREVLGNMCV